MSHPDMFNVIGPVNEIINKAGQTHYLEKILPDKQSEPTSLSSLSLMCACVLKPSRVTWANEFLLINIEITAAKGL